MLATLLFQLIVLGFIAFNILLLFKLFPVEDNQQIKVKRKKA